MSTDRLEDRLERVCDQIRSLEAQPRSRWTAPEIEELYALEREADDIRRMLRAREPQPSRRLDLDT